MTQRDPHQRLGMRAPAERWLAAPWPRGDPTPVITRRARSDSSHLYRLPVKDDAATEAKDSPVCSLAPTGTWPQPMNDAVSIGWWSRTQDRHGGEKPSRMSKHRIPA